MRIDPDDVIAEVPELVGKTITKVTRNCGVGDPDDEDCYNIEIHFSDGSRFLIMEGGQAGYMISRLVEK